MGFGVAGASKGCYKEGPIENPLLQRDPNQKGSLPYDHFADFCFEQTLNPKEISVGKATWISQTDGPPKV